MYVLATLLTLSLRFHQITNINQRASSMLPVRCWRFDYVTTTLPLRSWRLDCVTTTLLLHSWRLSYVHGDLQHARANQGINTSPVFFLALSSWLNVNLIKQSTSKKMPPRKGRKANATSTATQPPTIEPQQEPTPEDDSRQVEQDNTPSPTRS